MSKESLATAFLAGIEWHENKSMFAGVGAANQAANEYAESKAVPPAGGEVEKLGWVASDEEDGKFIDFVVWPKNVLDDIEVGTELVDRAHVTRLQAECDDALFKMAEQIVAAEKERDALKAEVDRLGSSLDSEVISHASDLSADGNCIMDLESELRETKEALTNARELLAEPKELCAISSEWFDKRDEFLAHQSAPADTGVHCTAHVDYKPESRLSVPETKEQLSTDKPECPLGHGHAGKWCGREYKCWLDPRPKNDDF